MGGERCCELSSNCDRLSRPEIINIGDRIENYLRFKVGFALRVVNGIANFKQCITVLLSETGDSR